MKHKLNTLLTVRLVFPLADHTKVRAPKLTKCKQIQNLPIHLQSKFLSIGKKLFARGLRLKLNGLDEGRYWDRWFCFKTTGSASGGCFCQNSQSLNTQNFSNFWLKGLPFSQLILRNEPFRRRLCKKTQ